MAIRIEENFMALEVDGAIVATARFSRYAAADGDGAWIVSTHAARLFSRKRGDRCPDAMIYLDSGAVITSMAELGAHASL